MIDHDKVFAKMHDLLTLHRDMSLTSFTSISMCLLCAVLQAVEEAPPMIRLQISRAVMEFVNEVTQEDEGVDNLEAWKVIDKLGMLLQLEQQAHQQYTVGARN
jgi:hypothetical protein